VNATYTKSKIVPQQPGYSYKLSLRAKQDEYFHFFFTQQIG